jgi:hypothetical protein
MPTLTYATETCEWTEADIRWTTAAETRFQKQKALHNGYISEVVPITWKDLPHINNVIKWWLHFQKLINNNFGDVWWW